MMDEVTKALTAIKAIKNWQANRMTSFTPNDILIDFADTILKALAAQSAAPVGEPMAYYVEHKSFGVELSLDPPSEDSVKRGWNATPLYATPSPIAPQWQPIETAPRDEDVLVWCDEGWDIARYSAPECDGPDSMGHDGGWFGLRQPMAPGRHIGNPSYFSEPQNQPWAWMPQPDPPYNNEGESIFPRAALSEKPGEQP